MEAVRPRTLADLINQVKAEDEQTLEAIARRADLPLATVGAWAVGSRGIRRPPNEESLRKLAVGLRRPEAEVFEAAGRIHPSRIDSDEAEGLFIARVYGELDERDKATARELLLSMRRRAAGE
ncbi:MAG TPA: hypothetical protein VFV01_47825 [Spirillospora sp.]|nr:hypothetical protein [Spirillospora sp.]